MKIFLVEDNEELNGYITDTLQKLNYDVKSCKDGGNAFKIAEIFFDLYIIDINLPNVNGLELVKKIRSVNKDATIFIISGDDNIDTILKAYDLGCDDYIKKPFDLREVIAKINILFKDKLEKKVKLTSSCYFDTEEKVVVYEGKTINLTPKESSLLNILIENMGKSVSNKDIEIAVWGKNFENGHVRQLISKLKKTLPCGSDIIQNHSSNGYKIVSS